MSDPVYPTFTIHTARELSDCLEAQMVNKFLTWQGVRHTVREFSRDARFYDVTSKRPVIMRDGEAVAIGVFSLLNWWETNGMTRL